VSVWAVVAAAGSGERLGADRPKAFARLGDRPLLAESLERLDGSAWIDAIVVAAPPGWEEPVILLAEELGCGKVSASVAGGSTRTASVVAALAEVPGDAAVVIVHDAARPILPEEVIERVLAPLSEGWDGVVPALPVPDTVKRVRGDEVVDTVDRIDLVVVQTPQAFRREALVVAHRAGATAEGRATDDAALLEAMGFRVVAIPGDPMNLKVTRPEDLALARALLADA
jgi:2-C-methyl-D-erythritol 4-phosphate cytidylyltransferase